MKTACVILFNPAISRLKQNLDAIAPQVDKVICVDNGSQNLAELEPFLASYHNTVLIPMSENVGIAKALNVAVRHAKEQGAQWILTLDQDSVVAEHLIERYEAHLDPTYGMLTSCRKDRNIEWKNHTNGKGEQQEVMIVPRCITSAAYLNIAAWEACEGFDEKLFIDYVDFDMCERMKQKGYQMLQVNIVGFLHELGDSRRVKFLGHTAQVENHSAFRKYYITRNSLYFAEKYMTGAAKQAEYTRLKKMVLWVILFEHNKFAKLYRMWRGFLDSKKM